MLHQRLKTLVVILTFPIFLNEGLWAQSNEKASPVEVTDLNQLDFQEAERRWKSSPKKRARDVTRDVSVEEILEPASDYSYSAFGKSDPFIRPNLGMTIQERDLDQNADGTRKINLATEIPMVSPLQVYPLDELEVKGVWVLRDGQARAIVMTPKKEGIVIKKGDPIAAGKVLKVERNHITVRQYRIREDGIREFEDIQLAIGLKSDDKKGVIKFNPGKAPEFVRFGTELEKVADAQEEVKKKPEPPPVKQNENEPAERPDIIPAKNNNDVNAG